MFETRTLTRVVGGLAIAAYFAGIIYAGIASLKTDAEPDIPDIVTAVITGTGGTLATFFGMVFGFNRANEAGASQKTKTTELTPPQSVAAWGYLASLVMAVVFWAIDGFSDSSAEVLRSLSMTCPGVFVGALAVSLNVPKGEPTA